MSIQSCTKCWECVKAYGGCSWADSFTPVEGWKATKNTKREWKKGKGVTSVDSYNVMECPEFVKDKREPRPINNTFHLISSLLYLTAKDYEEALWSNDTDEIKRLEEWFKSPFCALLCYEEEECGMEIIRKVKENFVKGGKKLLY